MSTTYTLIFLVISSATSLRLKNNYFIARRGRRHCCIICCVAPRRSPAPCEPEGQCQIILIFKFTAIIFFLLSVNVATVCYIPDIQEYVAFIFIIFILQDTLNKYIYEETCLQRLSFYILVSVNAMKKAFQLSFNGQNIRKCFVETFASKGSVIFHDSVRYFFISLQNVFRQIVQTISNNIKICLHILTVQTQYLQDKLSKYLYTNVPLQYSYNGVLDQSETVHYQCLTLFLNNHNVEL